ncbi:MAG: hypothetical protein ACKVZ6_05350 [Kineosporiaceae bacterium]
MTGPRPGRRRGLAAAAGGLLAVVLGAGAGAAPGLAATTGATDPTADPAQSGPARVAERTIKDDRITESSGLVASGRTTGILWTFNDSGGTARLFAVARSGRTAAVLDLRGVQAQDWEAATALRARDDTPLIAVGDIGDNRGDRPTVRIHVVAEPKKLVDGTVRPLRTITLTYPDQPVDAETLVADPDTGRLYVVTKGVLGGRVYAVPEQAWPGTRDTPDAVDATLELVGRVPLVLVTDGVTLPDGRVALRTYGELALMPPLSTLGDPEATWTPLATTRLPRQGQGEGIAVDRDGAFLLTTEGTDKPVLLFVAPAEVLAARPPEPTATPSQATDDGSTGDGPPGDGSGPSASGVAALGGVTALAVVAVGAAATATRRRRRHG